jgi:2-C-methyl-D-erythritol 2,4-cyclodiphosphate synthase
MRVGVGFDAHPFDPRRPLVLGGIEFPGSPGLAGHSDADVLTHAIADALLGAAGLGDLGGRFPNDERWKDASSLQILSEVGALLSDRGLAVGNVDATVIAEQPRLGPHRDQIVERIAHALGIERDLVSVKATTTDEMGFTGRREGIAAFAVVLVEQDTGL